MIEFVLTYDTQLCSDSFSSFFSKEEEKKVCNNEIILATKYLKGISITFFANQLVQMLEIENDVHSNINNFPLTEHAHRQGVRKKKKKKNYKKKIKKKKKKKN